MTEDMQKKMETLMYGLTKEAARSGFIDWLEEWGLTDNDYEELKQVWKDKLGIKKPYV